jgi:hypothetical protein
MAVPGLSRATPPVFVSFPAPSDCVFVRRGCEIDCVSGQTALQLIGVYLLRTAAEQRATG